MKIAPRNRRSPRPPLGLGVGLIVRLAATRGHADDTARLALAVQRGVA